VHWTNDFQVAVLSLAYDQVTNLSFAQVNSVLYPVQHR